MPSEKTKEAMREIMASPDTQTNCLRCGKLLLSDYHISQEYDRRIGLCDDCQGTIVDAMSAYEWACEARNAYAGEEALRAFARIMYVHRDLQL